MIVIFSTQEDISTHRVLEWLHYYKTSAVVINELNPIVDVFIEIGALEQDEVSFVLSSGQKISIKDIDVVWYRRGLHFFKFPYGRLNQHTHLQHFYFHLKSEYENLSQYFFELLRPLTIGDYNLAIPNKLLVLREAKKCGLLIPETRIITDKKNAFEQTHINKNITEVVNVKYEKQLFYNRTTLQGAYETNTFFPSLLQLNIKKFCELRAFFFMDRFFTMATMPDVMEVLETDNRDITSTKYFHRVAFDLPLEVERKLTDLITSLGYTTCSVDMIVDEKFDYYFLELNPTGQFSYLNTICNFNIEKYIALKLMNYECSKTKASPGVEYTCSGVAADYV